LACQFVSLREHSVDTFRAVIAVQYCSQLHYS
jgi:hypothetical protein